MPSRPMVSRKRKAKEDQEQEFLNESQDSLDTNVVTNKETDRLLLHNGSGIQMRVRHSLFAAFNVAQCGLQTCDELRDYPTCSLTVPHPVYIAPKHCARVDICHKRSLANSTYKVRLHTSRTRYESAWKANRNLRAKEKENMYHTSLFEFADRLHRHPDPFFHGGYDYYYAGGNLCVLPQDGHVLHVDGDDLRNLNVSQFPPQKDYTAKPLRFLCSQLVDEPCEIFEVKELNQLRDDRPNCYALRQRNSIILQSLLPHKTRVKPITCFKSKYTPFISFAQSPIAAHSFVVSTMTQHVRWYDLNSATPTLHKLYDLNRSSAAPVVSWNTVKAWREHTFLYANVQQLCLMDTRTTPNEWLRRSIASHASAMDCDMISALAASQFSNLVYAGTNHKLHCLDMRFMGAAATATASNRAYVCSWTHQLEFAPTFVETFRSGSSEYIALSSPVAGDLRICELTRERSAAMRSLSQQQQQQTAEGASESLNSSSAIKHSKYSYKSPTLPYQPPTLQEAYEAARRAGRCLQPDADLKQRLRCCTTGMAFYAGNADAYANTADALLLIATSNGDVYAHTIGERSTQAPEQRTTDASDAMMANYARQICELTQPPLNYTDVVDMKAMSRVFRCEALTAGRKEEVVEVVEVAEVAEVAAGEPKESHEVTATKTASRPKHFGRWQKSMHALHKYKDALVGDLLSIWDISYSEEKDLRLTQLSDQLRIKPDPQTIVSNWLNANTSERPMASIPIDNLRDSIKMEISMTSVAGGGEDGGTGLKGLNDSSFALSNSMNFGAFPQSTQLTDEIALQMDSSALEMRQNASALGLTTARPKIKKKKSTYVKGF